MNVNVEPNQAAATQGAPVMIMAGGTGGHIFPGIAVAQELRARSVPVLWLGSRGGLETRLVPQAGLPLETLRIGGVRGKGWRALATAPFRVIGAITSAWRLFGRVRPRSALSLGGFAAGPGGIAAWLRGVPLLVHEQNAIAGTTNRILSTFAKTRLCGFAGAMHGAQWVGNPVRSAIAELPPPDQRMQGRSGTLRLLVLGGSQGARTLNARLPRALASIATEKRPEIWHQCGAKFIDEARAAYTQVGVEARVDAFIDDMAAAYAWADLVVCRAGALTLAELAAAGVAALLVPFPFAVDDHQTKNAQAAVAAGAALLIAESEASVERLTTLLNELLGNRARLLAMALAAHAMARVDAAERIADACLQVAA